MPLRKILVEVSIPPPLAVDVSTPPPLSIDVNRQDAVPAFAGDNIVTPGDSVQVVRCAGMRMPTDIIVTAVPSSYGRISWNGSTLTVY